MSRKVFIVVTDEEGFNDALVGPMSLKKANKLVKKWDKKYTGDVTEPYQIASPVSISEFTASDHLEDEDEY